MTEEFSESSKLGMESAKLCEEDKPNSGFEPLADTRENISPESKEYRILEFIKSYNFPVSPYFVAHNLGLNHQSVKRILIKLHNEGRIRKTGRGQYTNLPPHGAGGSIGDVDVGDLGFARFQNLDVVSTADVGLVGDIGDVVFSFPGGGAGVLEVVVRFGSKLGRISWRLSCPDGVDFRGLQVVVALIEERLISMGFNPPFGWEVHNREVFRDVLGVRLEGLQSITLNDFMGDLMKIYSKPFGVRVERRSSRPVRVEDLDTYMMGNIPQIALVERVDHIDESVVRMGEAFKVMNRNLGDLIREVRGKK
jgi:hypothetical protein